MPPDSPNHFLHPRLGWRPHLPVTGRAALPAVAQAALTPARGLPEGERALVATSVARRLGNLFAGSHHATLARQQLRRNREIDLILEEGFPSPLTGRLGAIASSVSALSATPPALAPRDIWRLYEERLDDQDVVDLILIAALQNGVQRGEMSLGRAVGTAGE